MTIQSINDGLAQSQIMKNMNLRCGAKGKPAAVGDVLNTTIPAYGRHESRSADSRLGIGRIEVFVSVCLSVILFLNLPPIVERARETARRYQCVDNLRRLGTALQSYYSTDRILPAAAWWTAGDENIALMYENPETPGVTHLNWVEVLLPHLGLDELAARFDDRLPLTAKVNAAARMTRLPVMVCPDDTFNQRDNHYRWKSPDGVESEFARGNYAMNGGSHRDHLAPCNTASPCPGGFQYEFDEQTRGFRWYGNGVAGINTCFRLDDFHNGQSTTVALEEIRAGVSPADSRGTWALGQIGGSITWAHGVSGDDVGPNNRRSRADDILGCKELYKTHGEHRLIEMGMPCCPYCMWNAQATARSLHARGVNVLMLDGAVRFILDNINPSVWHVIHSRETPREMLEIDFDSRLTGTETQSSEVAWNDRTDYFELPELPPQIDQRPLQTLVNSLGTTFVLLPVGEFIMGLPDKGNDRAVPRNVPPHHVRITHPFYLAIHEVTQAEFERVMLWNPSWHSATAHALAAFDEMDTANFPVEQVTWNDAVDFCNALSELPDEKLAGRRYRLPTEAEWEYGCRAGQRGPHVYVQRIEDGDLSGETAGRNNKMADQGIREPLPLTQVGSYPPNEWGLYDMRGNVWEWCQDWFARDYYSHSPIDNPQGPTTGYFRVVRGCDWVFVGEECKINRTTTEPFRRSPFMGFRVVCESLNRNSTRPE